MSTFTILFEDPPPPYDTTFLEVVVEVWRLTLEDGRVWFAGVPTECDIAIFGEACERAASTLAQDGCPNVISGPTVFALMQDGMFQEMDDEAS